jgi:hypothetical protein
MIYNTWNAWKDNCWEMQKDKMKREVKMPKWKDKKKTLGMTIEIEKVRPQRPCLFVAPIYPCTFLIEMSKRSVTIILNQVIILSPQINDLLNWAT